MTPSTNYPQRFSCNFPGCTSSYKRREHLTRHKAKHTGSHLCVCPLCDRNFSRRDSLRRHVRQDHAIPESHSIRSPAACHNCRLAKTRCRGGAPCLNCHTKGYECDLPRPTSTATTSVSSADEQEIQPGVDSTVLDDRNAAIKHYVDIYFAHFHAHWPILHRATFSIPDEPPLLVQAVMIIGLWVSDKPSAREAAVDLHDRLGSCIREQMVQWENPLPRNEIEGDGLVSKCPIATYQGILLYLIFSLIQNSNIRSLGLGLSLSSYDYQILSALVQVCLRNKVFHYPDMLERYEGITPMACIWVGMEEMSRLGLALYKVSALCKRENSSSNGIRLLQLSDLQFPVPDSRHLWEAESNQELARLLRLDGVSGRFNNIYTPQNWISTSAKALESGSERWWL
ncbi:hypothetical protein N7456_001173 [Penicillium angulare]|uniref:Uncharacterized protein n=1 Tax=Penicillium angulare TaxID=116970 RepID=A0A9W9KST7_9EURO|nr:hypothetical protein N7456_001173 [Penicillium angulare]